MQSWPLHHVATLPAAAPLCRGSEVVAAMIDALGEPDFSKRLLNEVNRVLPAGSLSAYVLSRQAAPELVASATHEKPDRTPECWQAYRGSLYRDDRTFDPAWSSAGTALTYCTQDSFAPVHRQRIYKPARSLERLSVTMPLEAGRLLAVNLYRNIGQAGFSADDTARAATLAMPLLACVRQEARRMLRPAAPGIRERLAHRCPRLTARELDVLEHLARGCTYDGISAALGLSATTVKTYRERAFLKLGLHFRSELSALLIDTTPGEQAA